ncbi:MAG: hypothetical protein K6D96_03915 [Acetatifactor sp.]|nr:hypothetical protein [Acetatifactor sp.]
MNEQQMMEFPETFEKFARDYGFKDDKEVYTNGSDLIPIFRVKQWLEHGNKLRTIETDTAYECGKHANNKEWLESLEKLKAEIPSMARFESADGQDLVMAADVMQAIEQIINSEEREE